MCSIFWKSRSSANSMCPRGWELRSQSPEEHVLTSAPSVCGLHCWSLPVFHLPVLPGSLVAPVVWFVPLVTSLFAPPCFLPCSFLALLALRSSHSCPHPVYDLPVHTKAFVSHGLSLWSPVPCPFVTSEVVYKRHRHHHKTQVLNLGPPVAFWRFGFITFLFNQTFSVSSCI